MIKPVAAALAATLFAFPAMSMTNIVSYTVYADGPCDGVEYVPAFIGTEKTWFSKIGGKMAGPQTVSGTPFPAKDLMVIGYAFNVQYSSLFGQPPMNTNTVERTPSGKYLVMGASDTMAMAGIKNSFGGDYLSPKEIGPGTWTQMFPAGTGMTLTYGPIQNHHVDMHVRCDGGGTWNATLTLYTVPTASRPVRWK